MWERVCVSERPTACVFVWVPPQRAHSVALPNMVATTSLCPTWDKAAAKNDFPSIFAVLFLPSHSFAFNTHACCDFRNERERTCIIFNNRNHIEDLCITHAHTELGEPLFSLAHANHKYRSVWAITVFFFQRVVGIINTNTTNRSFPNTNETKIRCTTTKSY